MCFSVILSDKANVKKLLKGNGAFKGVINIRKAKSNHHTDIKSEDRVEINEIEIKRIQKIIK